MAAPAERPNQLREELLDGLQRLAHLPDWLSAIADPGLLAAALQYDVPEFASGDLALQGCVVKRIRLKKDRWIGPYDVNVVESGRQQPRRVELRGTLFPTGVTEGPTACSGAFGQTDWRGYLPELRLALQLEPPDADLPALALLTDPESARELLERSIRDSSPAYKELRLESVAHRVVRYKPGSRCTIVYSLQYPRETAIDPGWPKTVVVKTYQGSKGQNAYEAMRALWDSPLSTGDIVSVAEPLAFIPELNVLVQRALPAEQTLKDLIRTSLGTPGSDAASQVPVYLRKSALGLAALHRCGVVTGEVRRWDQEFADVVDLSERLAAVIPGLANATSPLLTRLAAASTAHPEDTLRPTHGSFRPAQVLIHAGRIGFVDFDGFCQAEAARDLALFLWNVKSVGLNTSEEKTSQPVDAESEPDYLDRLEALGADFLGWYRQSSPCSSPRLALWEELNLLTGILDYWVKAKPGRLKNIVYLLEQSLNTSGLA